MHLPLLAHFLNLHDFSGDLPLGVYRGVEHDFALQVVRSRGRTLAYDVKGSRLGEVHRRPAEVLMEVEHVVEDVLVTTKLALALALEIKYELGMEHTVWISRGVRNCVQSTFEGEDVLRGILVLRWSAGTDDAKAERIPGGVRAGYCSMSRILRLRWSRLLARAEDDRYKHERHPCEHRDRPRERSEGCSVHHFLSVVVVGQELDTLVFSSQHPQRH